MTLSGRISLLEQLLRTLQPVLHSGVVAFCRLAAEPPLTSTELIGLFREAEGTTVIVPERIAIENGWTVAFRAAWITLSVHSDLQAVGLTAAVARALADAGISCNVVAAVTHDHIFVPAELGKKAVSVLAALHHEASDSTAVHRERRETGEATGRWAFRGFEPEDRAACLALFDDNCPEFFAANERADYEAFLDANVSGYRVCLTEGRVIAAFGVLNTQTASRCRLSWILVAKDSQRRGVGGAIMAEVLRVASVTGARWLDIAASHKSASYFARFGAEEVSRLEDGWGPGMHRIDMTLRLSERNAPGNSRSR